MSKERTCEKGENFPQKYSFLPESTREGRTFGHKQLTRLKKESDSEEAAERAEEAHLVFRVWPKSSVVTLPEAKGLTWTFIRVSQMGPSPLKK